MGRDRVDGLQSTRNVPAESSSAARRGPWPSAGRLALRPPDAGVPHLIASLSPLSCRTVAVLSLAPYLDQPEVKSLFESALTDRWAPVQRQAAVALGLLVS